MRILVIGSLNMDETAEMDRLPSTGQTVIGSSLRYAPGGKGNNQCISAARLGGCAEMAGMLGNDAHGKELRALLEREGVPHRCVFSCGLPTGLAQIQVDAAGQNRICVVPSANYAFGPDELDKTDAALRECEIVLLQLELRPDVTAETVRRARSYGKTVILNPAPAADLPEDIFPMVDFLTPNETELSFLTGLPTGSDGEIVFAASSLRKKGFRNVVVTCGARGVYADCEAFKGFADGFRVKAEDTVAAGDCFNGAFAVGLAEKMKMRKTLRFANAAAAISVQRPGAVPSLPYRFEVDAFLREHPEKD